MERFKGIRQHYASFSGNTAQPVFVDAYGAHLKDENGLDYLCLNDISCILGYRHPRFTVKTAELMQTQMLCHLGAFSEPKETLINHFMDATHGNFEQLHITGSGGEAVDWALKIARCCTGRDGIIAFRNALHGRSFAGAFISDTPVRKEGFGTGLENVRFWDHPGDVRTFEPNAGDGHDIAAIIIEPYQALRGMDSPNAEYWQWLRSYTREHGIVLIFDEIQTGFGKTGSFFAYEEIGIVPDILLAGKGMSNGFGLGAMLMTKEICSCVKPVSLSGGSADNNLMCSIINLVFDILREEDLVAHAKRTGERFASELLRITTEKGIDARIHGKGLFFSLELPEGMADRIWYDAKAQRIFLGRAGNRIVVRAPLVLTDEDVNLCCEVLRKALQTTE